MIPSAVVEAAAIFKVSFTAAGANMLAEIKDNVIAILATSAQDHEPQLQHSRKAAAKILDMSLRSLAAYIKAGTIKVRHEGGSIKILHTEISRFLKSDCRKPVASKKKLLQMRVKQPASANLNVG
jgi:DNA gyrase/topoisomerase IV subunit A